MTIISEFRDSWLKHRVVLERLVQETESTHVRFKPWEGAMPLGELIVHIGSSGDMFLKTLLAGVFVSPAAPPEFETMNDVRSILQSYTEQTKQDFESLQPEHLEKEIDLFGYEASGRLWLENMRDHEIHHKGQLFVYVRMTGQENVPFFTLQPKRRQERS
ncbi:DinB family protein [Fictibacillus macauensis ZFHKF-1]|uniref:DinB family protein n=1 Tax=Fictibacillus macauensis ZFHKF-1 TaxID=1196324 RepID=I8AGG0_9BACL|nr:DinB family protein [Fictibacillus macauensis]EIT84772.1 DinB family protein [Fictibacillus macauensis ZFHKF-1]